MSRFKQNTNVGVEKWFRILCSRQLMFWLNFFAEQKFRLHCFKCFPDLNCFRLQPWMMRTGELRYLTMATLDVE